MADGALRTHINRLRIGAVEDESRLEGEEQGGADKARRPHSTVVTPKSMRFGSREQSRIVVGHYLASLHRATMAAAIGLVAPCITAPNHLVPILRRNRKETVQRRPSQMLQAMREWPDNSTFSEFARARQSIGGEKAQAADGAGGFIYIEKVGV